MRILVLNWLDRKNLQAGGAEVHLHETFGRLVERGHRVTLLTSGFPGCRPEEVVDGIRVLRAGGRYTYSVSAPLHYGRHLADEGFDVVVEDLNKVPVFSPYWVRAPVVLLVHHLFGSTAFQEASLPVAALTWALERPVPWVFRSVPTIAVSRSTADDLERRGLPGDRISVIPNGVDVDHYVPDPEGGGRFPTPTLLYLGRLKRYKRVDLPIRALAAVVQEGLDCRMVVAGKGEDRPRLEGLVRELGLEDRVRFAGFVGEEEKLDLFRRSWVHVFTSPKEGWGIANLEAAACGTPTVASDAPGLRDSVRHGETGYLVPHADVPALADRIRELVLDPGRAEAMGRRAREFALQYSWDRTADAVERFLESRVAKGAASR